MKMRHVIPIKVVGSDRTGRSCFSLLFYVDGRWRWRRRKRCGSAV